MVKLQEKQEAIKLRRRGLSYSEILKQIPVAKSTLSLWLRSVGLSKEQQQRLTKKKKAAILRGGKARRNQRIILTQKIYREAEIEINKLSQRELWLMGIMLYWAEGSKEKENNTGQGVQFTNSDPYMIKIFLKWLFEICKINVEKINLSIYIHENHRNNLNRVKKYWSYCTGLPINYFEKIYFKKHKPKTNRKNIGDSYYGILVIKVRASSTLNRKIQGWIRGINKYYWGKCDII
ncbi:hypothetical protein ACFL29_01200 [Patescibacteria group bacterium]